MRKLSLLAAAAMVAGGSAFAMDGGGVSISGEANFGVKFAESDDDSKNELQFHHEFKVTFAASGTTDGGIGFGGEMTLDNTESVSRGTAKAAPTGVLITKAQADAFAAVYNTDGTLKSTATAAQLALVNAFEAKYGISAAGFTENDVVENGSKTAFSGYQKATVKGVSIPSVFSVAGELEGTPRGAIQVSTLNPLLFSTGTANTDDTRHIHRNVTEVTILTGDGTNANASRTIKNVISVSVLDDTADGDGTEATDDNNALDEGEQIRITYLDDEGREQTRLFTYSATGVGTVAGNATTAGSLNGVLEIKDTTTIVSPQKKTLSEAYIAGLSASVDDADKHSVDNHGEVYISMDMHKLTIGSDLDAADKVAGGLADPGFDGIGIDDVAEGVWGKSAADVRYDGDFGVAKVAISYGDNAGDAEWAAGFSFDVEPVTMGAGFDSNGVMSVGMGFSQGLISMNALYSTDSDRDEADNEALNGGSALTANHLNATHKDYVGAKHAGLRVGSKVTNKPDLKNQAFGVDVSYQISEATSLTLVAAQSKQESAHWSRAAVVTTAEVRDNPDTPADTTKAAGLSANAANDKWVTTSKTKDAFGVGFSHDLGGGATLKAGAGSVDSNAVADLGITMKF